MTREITIAEMYEGSEGRIVSESPNYNLTLPDGSSVHLMFDGVPQFFTNFISKRTHLQQVAAKRIIEIATELPAIIIKFDKPVQVECYKGNQGSHTIYFYRPRS